MNVIGLISGTSADGIDAALVQIEGSAPALDVSLRSFTFVPFTKEQRARIFRLFDPQTGTVDDVCEMNFLLGQWFADAALQAMESAGVDREAVDLIASHGQTIYHSVGPEIDVSSTLQIGEGAVIAAQTGITTVADFRVADVAAGGQGAPLVSYMDWLLLRAPHKVRAVQNIGGIANVTYLPPSPDPDATLAFDTGPGNMIIDDVAGRATEGKLSYDKDGQMAARGEVDAALLEELMAHPYFTLAVPKTTGREQFGEQFGAQIWRRAKERGLAAEDVVATVTAFTATSIAQAYRRFLPQMPDEIIVGGGGAHNPTLLQMLSEQLAPAPVRTHQAVGMNDDAKEATAFAIIAYEAIHGRPGNLPTCTQASAPVVLGKIVPGANYTTLLHKQLAKQNQA